MGTSRLGAVPGVVAGVGGELGEVGGDQVVFVYDYEPYRDQLRQRGSTPLISRKRTRDNNRPVRWVVEQTLALLHQFRRLATPSSARPSSARGGLSASADGKVADRPTQSRWRWPAREVDRRLSRFGLHHPEVLLSSNRRWQVGRRRA